MGRKAGTSSLARYRALRIEAVRREWRSWALMGSLIVGTAVGVIVTEGWASVVFAWTLGFSCAAAVACWLIGDVHGLTHLWGAVGERDTAALLGQLGSDWHLENDIEYAYGNWDHVLVGPPGLFVLDTKRLSGPIAIKDDALSSGRTRYNGGSFRGAAYALHEALGSNGAKSPWVQSVVVVWSGLEGEAREERSVVYVRAEKLVEWLEGQPPRLSSGERLGFVAYLRALALPRG